MARTDIHRPSAIVPAEYDFVTFRYIDNRDLGGSMEIDPMSGKLIATHIKHTGGKFSTHEHGGSCHVCGAHAMYTAVFYHAPSNTYINTGLDCAEKMELDCGNGDMFRKGIRARIEALAGKRKAKAVLESLGMAAAYDIYAGEYCDLYEERTVRDIVSKLVQYGSISDRQTAFVKSLLAKIAGRAEIEAAKAERKAVEAATSKHVGAVGERREFILTVNATPHFETAYGTLYINICSDAQGNTVIYKGGKTLAAKGSTLTVKATVKEHGERDGVKQTVISRPA